MLLRQVKILLGLFQGVPGPLQGLLGGLRVVWLADEIGIFHGVLAQGFLFLLVAVAVLSSSWWRRLPPVKVSPALRRLLWLATGLVVLQLVLGATMRHRHAGLAVPDFPLAYGRVWPHTNPEAIAAYNRQRIEVHAARPIAAADVWLHMLHRLGAAAVLLSVAAAAWRARRHLPAGHPLRRTVLAWLALVATQFALGALTVWTNKAADVATAHVVFGSLALVTGGLTCLMAGRRAPEAALPAPAAPSPSQNHPSHPAWSAA